MDVRALDGALARRIEAGLKSFNDRHPWSHNDHFHGWMLRRLPNRRRTAIDVGCGRGDLLRKLAGRFDEVVGLDIDERMRNASASRCAGLSNVRIGREDLADLAGPADLVTMIATLHHLDAVETFREVRRLLAPGGRLLVIGLAPPSSARDIGWDIASIVTNPIIGLAKHPRSVRKPSTGPPFPVKDPTMPYDELARLAADVLPGVRMRHRLGFRFTLEWTKPE